MDLAGYQAKSRDKLVNYSCQFMHSKLIWLVSLLFNNFIYVCNQEFIIVEYYKLLM